MPIQDGDIRIYASQRMLDTPDGGGRITGTVIEDGQSNNIFPDVSDLDTAYGRVSMRLVYPAVRTDDTDTLFGARLSILEPPEEPSISVLAFRANGPAESRAEAQSRLENFLGKGPVYPGQLWGTQYQGSRAITIYQRPEIDVPEVGDVLFLIRDEGGSSHLEQPVRIKSISEQLQNFDTPGCNQTYTRRVINAEITDPLVADFVGPEMSCQDTSTAPARIRQSVVADASAYYGTTTLAAPITATQLTLQADSLFGQLVPSTQSETPILDAPGAGTRTETIGTVRSREISVAQHSTREQVTETTRKYNFVFIAAPLPRPGTVQVSYRAAGKWYSVADDGAGSLEGVGAGSVNYTTGSINLTTAELPDIGSLIIVNWGSAIRYVDRSGQAGWRPPEEIFQLPDGAIEPGTFTATWYSGGVERTASDDGAGGITGDASGEIEYHTGSVWLAPSQMPDAGSQIQCAYQAGLIETETISVSPDGQGFVSVTTAEEITPGTLSVEWYAQSTVKTSTGRSQSRKTARQFASEAVSFYRPWTPGRAEARRRSRSNGSSRSYSRDSDQSTTTVDTFWFSATDGGDGYWYDQDDGLINYGDGQFTLKVEPESSAEARSADYATGASSEIKETGSNGSAYARSSSSALKSGQTFSESIKWALAGGSVVVRYRPAGNVPAVKTYTHTPEQVTIDLAPYTTDRIVPGTVQFSWMGSTYRDFEGSIYRDGTETVPGTLSGTIDYDEGVVTLTDYAVGSGGFSLDQIWTSPGDWRTARLFLRTAGAPVKPGGFVISVIDWAGEQLIGTSDASGVVSGDKILGSIDYDTGAALISFGEYVQESTLTEGQRSEPWYDAQNIELDGTIWVPHPVDPQTARYNAVVYTYLPLSKEVLGLDPVRLPQDGRVIMVRAGDLIFVHHTQRDEYASLSAGQVIDAGRTRLWQAWIEDSAGVRLPESVATPDLDAGTITLADPLDLGSMTAPFTLVHRIADLRMVSDVEISGQIQVTRPFSHDFPAGAYISGVLIGGDRQARVTGLFDQKTWSGTFSDSRSGDEATGTYNDVTYPIAVTNRGAITERWALIFTGSSSFRIVGETVGEIGAGDTASVCQPNNPNENVPYFVLQPEGWGSGWSAGNVLRFNTVGTEFGAWIVRTVLQGDLIGDRDKFRLGLLGNVNTD